MQFNWMIVLIASSLKCWHTGFLNLPFHWSLPSQFHSYLSFCVSCSDWLTVTHSSPCFLLWSDIPIKEDTENGVHYYPCQVVTVQGTNDCRLSSLLRSHFTVVELRDQAARWQCCVIVLESMLTVGFLFYPLLPVRYTSHLGKCCREFSPPLFIFRMAEINYWKI